MDASRSPVELSAPSPSPFDCRSAGEASARTDLSRRAMLGRMVCGAVGAVASPVHAAAQASDEEWRAVIEAAYREGEVLMYSTRADADNNKVLDAFMKLHPRIKARALRLMGGAIQTRVDQELKAGALVADLMLHSEHQLLALKQKEGMLVEPNGPSVALWKGAEPYFADGRVQLTAEPWVIGYNTRLVKNRPGDWDSLLESTEFKGRVGLNEVSGLTVAVWFDFIARKKPGYFDKMVALQPRIYPNSAPLTAGLTSGELAWSPYSLASTIEPMKAKGAPIDYVVPSSGTWAVERVGSIFKGVPHPNAARVLLDFMMSAQGQQLMNENRAGFSVAPGLQVKGGLDVDLKRVARIDYLTYGANEVRSWQNKVDQLFRR